MEAPAEKEENVDDEARLLWSMLSRVEPLTRQSLRASCLHATTLKLDGRRVLVHVRDGRVRLLSSLGWERLEAEPRGDCVLDGEELDGVVHVFDALFAGSRDLRRLPLPERLRAASACLPTGTVLKEYRPLRSRSDLLRSWRESAEADACDGLIFVSLAAPYAAPPLKFKRRVSFDFALEAKRDGRGFVLLASQAGRLVPFQRAGRPCVAAARGALARLPPKLSRSHRVVVEFELEGRAWAPLRLRPDRRAPNNVETVRRNLALIERGEHAVAWMLRAVPIVDVRESFACWLEAQRRLLLEEAGGCCQQVLHPSLLRYLDGEDDAENGGCEGSLVAVFAAEPTLDAALRALPSRALLLCPSEIPAGAELLFEAPPPDARSLERRLRDSGYTAQAQAPPSAPASLLELPPALERVAAEAVLLVAQRGVRAY